jgi:hypothetical protein
MISIFAILTNIIRYRYGIDASGIEAEPEPIEITCFFEELPLLGVGVVSKSMCLTWSSHSNLCILGRTFRIGHPTRLHSDRGTG